MRRPRIVRYAFASALVLIFFIFLYFFNSGECFVYNLQTGPDNVTFEKAVIVDIVHESIKEDEKVKKLTRGTQDLKVKILTGKHTGEIHRIKNYLSDRFNVYAKEGRTIIVCVDSSLNGKYRVTVNNYNRSPLLYLLIFLFMIVLIITGGGKGVRSLVGLLFTFTCIMFFFVPMLFRGHSPVFSSILTAFIISIVTVLCISGWSIKSVVAISGTTLGVIIAGILSNIFGTLAHINGFHTEEVETLVLIAKTTGMDVGELVFAGILLASLGAVMDVAVSIASSSYEIFMTDRKVDRRRLFISGMNVGRDMMGSMSNTLILAFAGVSINSLILIHAYNVNYTQLINLNITGIEVLRGMCGSIAIILTVPVVSCLSSWFFPFFIQQDR